MSEPLSVDYLDLIKERWARWAEAGLPVSKDRRDLMAEVERLRAELARQAEQIVEIVRTLPGFTRIPPPADDPHYGSSIGIWDSNDYADALAAVLKGEPITVNRGLEHP